MTPPKSEQRSGFGNPDFSWAEYIKYRPVYPASYYNRIYQHHTSHLNTWDTAHDVGAGAGIAAQELANRFSHVVVSDPNARYVSIASERLRRDFDFPADRFSFLCEGAENSSVVSGSVDLVTICEAIHWTDIPATMDEAARQLKSGGTLAISLYTSPLLLDNAAAQKAWEDIIAVFVNTRLDPSSPEARVSARAKKAALSSLDNVPFPTDDWAPGVRRIQINFCGRANALSVGFPDYGLKVDGELDCTRGDDCREVLEGEGDWMGEKTLEELKGHVRSLQPDFEEVGIKGLWERLGRAIGEGGRVKVAWPVVQLLATRR